MKQQGDSDDIYPPGVVPMLGISDTHFYHANIREYCPWRKTWCDDGANMNHRMIEAWNDVVKPNDYVLHCGDLALAKRDDLARLVRKLHGKIILVRGNHDSSKTAMYEAGLFWVGWRFAYTHPILGRLVCRHVPQKFTQRDYDEADLLIHGHLHGDGHRGSVAEPFASKCRDLSLDAVRVIHPVPLEKVFS